MGLTDKKVAIFGGGFCGLVLACKLSKIGYEVTVFEEDKQNGGLLQTFRTSDGFLIEKSYHHFFKHDKLLLELFDSLGLTKKIIWHKSSTSIYDKSFYKFSGFMDLINYPKINITSKIRFLISTWLLGKFSFKQYASKSSKYLIIKTFGKEAWKRIWEPLFIGKFSNHSDAIGASWFQSRIRKRANSRHKDSEYLGYLDGSFQVLIDKLEKEILKNKGEIKNSQRIDKIIHKNNKFYINDNKFDILISTISLEQIDLYPFLDSDEIKKYKQIEYLDAICLFLESPKQLAKFYWNNIIDKQSPFVALIEHTNLVPKNNYSNKNLIYLVKYLDKTDPTLKLSDSEIIKIWTKYLKNIFPSLDIKKIKTRLWRFSSAQPIIKVGHIPLENTTSVKNFYITSMAHIYPEDRGLDEAIREANRIIKLITNESTTL